MTKDNVTLTDPENLKDYETEQTSNDHEIILVESMTEHKSEDNSNNQNEKNTENKNLQKTKRQAFSISSIDDDVDYLDNTDESLRYKINQKRIINKNRKNKI